MRFSIMHIMILITFNNNKILLNFDRLISDEQNKSEFPAQCRSNGEKELTFSVGDENQCKVYVTFGRVFMEDLQKITTGNTVSFSYNEKYKTNLAKFETWLMLKTTFIQRLFLQYYLLVRNNVKSLCTRVLISEIGNLVWILVICTSSILFYI